MGHGTFRPCPAFLPSHTWGPCHALYWPPLPPREKPQPKGGAEAGPADSDLWANGCTLKARAQLLDLFRPRSLRSPPARRPFLARSWVGMRQIWGRARAGMARASRECVWAAEEGGSGQRCPQICLR